MHRDNLHICFKASAHAQRHFLITLALAGLVEIGLNYGGNLWCHKTLGINKNDCPSAGHPAQTGATRSTGERSRQSNTEKWSEWTIGVQKLLPLNNPFKEITIMPTFPKNVSFSCLQAQMGPHKDIKSWLHSFLDFELTNRRGDLWFYRPAEYSIITAKWNIPKQLYMNTIFSLPNTHILGLVSCSRGMEDGELATEKKSK